MRKLGKTTLDEEFKWTPSQLLTLITAIDKICPEESEIETPLDENQQRMAEHDMISE
jgi:hypothetical protein